MKKKAIPALVSAIEAAVQEAIQANAQEPDDGTCNLDATVLVFGRTTAPLRAALDPLGYFSRGGRFLVALRNVGQAGRRTATVQACAALLERRLQAVEGAPYVSIEYRMD